MKTIYERAMQRAVAMSIYVEEMFKTGHDAANPATVRAFSPTSINVVGLALRDERKLVDTITKLAPQRDERIVSTRHLASFSFSCDLPRSGIPVALPSLL